MTETRHILICGDVGVGKSSLIRRLSDASGRPVCGFVTLRRSDGNGKYSVYIHPAQSKRRTYTPANRVGICNSDGGIHFPAVFNTCGVPLLKAEEGRVIMMDELGFMENEAELFRAAVLSTLDGNIPVIAAVKNQSTPFLDAVRSHKNADLFIINNRNREKLYTELLPRVMAWDK
ncbi:MAG: nucleoside-triphosphatase [Oscillospiraceae bacterium]